MTQEQDAKTLQDTIADTVRAVADHLTAHLAVAAVLDALDTMLRTGQAMARRYDPSNDDDADLTQSILGTLQGDTGCSHSLRLEFGQGFRVWIRAADFDEKLMTPATSAQPPIAHETGAQCDHGQLARSCELCRMGNDLVVANSLLMRLVRATRAQGDVSEALAEAEEFLRS